MTLEAIHHASMASDDEMVERIIKQSYLEMMNPGEMSWVRSWTGNLSQELVYCGDFANAARVLNETIQSGHIARAINNPVAAYCLLARAQVHQGRLHAANDLLQKAAQLIHTAGGRHLGATGLVEVETAALLCEWNDLDGALARLQRGLDALPWWGKADDFCLAYITLARVQLARGSRTEAAGALERAARLVQTRRCLLESPQRGGVRASSPRAIL